MKHYSAAALARIDRLRRLQASAAQSALAKAGQDECEARAAQEHALAGRDAALAHWHGQLAGSAFSPELSAGLAAALGDCEARVEEAGTQLARAAAARRDHEDRWHESEARSRQTGALLEESRRREARARDEKALLAVADRVTFSWRRP